MTNQEKIKNWIAHWEAVRDLAAKDGEFCPIEIDRRPSETKVGAVLVEVS